MVPRVVDQRGQPASTRFLALRADDPENCRLPVARRLRLEELPRLVVCPELLLMLRAELGLVPVLVRVDPRLLRHPSLECFDPGRVHAPRTGELLHVPDVDEAPVAAGLARRKADGIALVVDPPPHSVDPAEAERLADRLGPGQRGEAGVLLVEPDHHLAFRVVVRLEPGAELMGSREEVWLHAA